MNKNIIKIATVCITFLICTIIGYLIANLSKGGGDEGLPPINPDPVSIPANPPSTKEDNDTLSIKAKEDSIDTETLEEQDSTIITLVASTPRLYGETYSFTATIKGVNQRNVQFELWSHSARVAKSKNGIFTNIPAVSGGSYNLNAIDKQTGKILATKRVTGFNKSEESIGSKMSASQFQSLLLSHSDNSLLGGRNPKVAKSIYIRVQGMHDDENIRPDDVQGVRDKIRFGIWKSAIVISVGYDNQNKINSAVIQPVY